MKHFNLGRGEFTLSAPLNITTDRVSIVGAGRTSTVLKANFDGEGTGVVHIAPKTRSSARHCVDLVGGTSREDIAITVDKEDAFNPGSFLRIEADNDTAFLDNLGAKTWRHKRPPVRRTLAHVRQSRGDQIELARPVGTAFPAGSKVCAIELVQETKLAHMTILYGSSAPLGADDYSNSAPTMRVDGVALHRTAFARIRDVDIVNAGRHFLHLDWSYSPRVENVGLSGARNKGPDGHGYFRIARTFYGSFNAINVEGLRHITVQWSSHDNIFKNVNSDTDINFHGGFSHHNKFENSCVDLRAGHKWPAVYRTPSNAAWAPPDGKKNETGDVACLPM